MALIPAAPAPGFSARTPSEPEFTFSSVAGRYILLAFMPLDPEQAGPALKILAANRAIFDDARISAFVVTRDPQTAATARDLRGLRWILDDDGAVSRLYDALDDQGVENPRWVILDPTLRVLAFAQLSSAEKIFSALNGLPQPADHAGVPLHAPVLIAPRVFEPEFCLRLIALHQAGDAQFTGVMRDAGDRTVAVMDDLKRRRDIWIEDPDLQAEIRRRLETRLFPMIERSFAFQVTEIERYLVSCYDTAEGGVFRAHRDDTTKGTAHRRFACSINLNADFEGGDLRFPEFGSQTYRPPEGGAVVFSCSLLHEATPMRAGRRYAFLPFFFDAAGKAVLDAYQAGA